MANYTLIDQYLDALRARLAWRRDVDDLLAEAADHLYSAAARVEADGESPVDAQRRALERFGDPDALATAFATTPSGKIAVPTTFTQSAGTMANVSGILWATAGLGNLLAGWLDLRDLGGVPTTVMTLSALLLFGAAALTVIVMIALHQRHGHFGPVGMAGIVVAAFGVPPTLMVWAFPVWGGLLGVGTMMVAATMLSRDLAPRWMTILFGSGLLAGGALWAALRAAEVGTPNAYGDYWLVNGTSVLTGSMLVALGLFMLGGWLRKEEPANLTEPGRPLAA